MLQLAGLYPTKDSFTLSRGKCLWSHTPTNLGAHEPATLNDPITEALNFDLDFEKKSQIDGQRGVCEGGEVLGVTLSNNRQCIKLILLYFVLSGRFRELLFLLGPSARTCVHLCFLLTRFFSKIVQAIIITFVWQLHRMYTIQRWFSPEKTLYGWLNYNPYIILYKGVFGFIDFIFAEDMGFKSQNA